jgi:hypothetical protein
LAIIDKKINGLFAYCQSGFWKKAQGSASEGIVFSTFNYRNSSGGFTAGICIYRQGADGRYEGKYICPNNTYAWRTHFDQGEGGG